MPLPEPWLRGPLPSVGPLVSNLFYTFVQAREELAAALAGLAAGEIWSRPHGLASVGFHVRHMGGAAERLGCYLLNAPLTAEQLREMKAEAEPGASGDELLTQLEARFESLERDVQAIDPARLEETREVGRARLPSTAIGLIVHIAEHTQRHLGQAVTMAKLVKALRDESGSGPAA
jgi:hypothetical protein